MYNTFLCTDWSISYISRLVLQLYYTSSVLRVIFQKKHHRDAPYYHYHISDCRKHGSCRYFLCIVVHIYFLPSVKIKPAPKSCIQVPENCRQHTPYEKNAYLSYNAAPSSSIQTILLVLESHQILTWTPAKSCVFTLADYTANRESHPALKIYHYSVVWVSIPLGPYSCNTAETFRKNFGNVVTNGRYILSALSQADTASSTSFHLPERASHSTHKAPLALHIGFQIFRALPICLPECFILLR